MGYADDELHRPRSSRSISSNNFSIPDIIMIELMHNFLRGELLELRCVSKRWNMLVFRAIGYCAALRIKEIPDGFRPKVVPEGYDGALEICLKINTCRREFMRILAVRDLMHSNVVPIVSLTLERIMLETDGTELLANAIYGTDSLKTLNLLKSRIRGEDVKILADALCQNSSIRSLCIVSNYFWCIGAQAIATVLRANSNITSLELRYNGIGAEGGRALADALLVNTSLVSLDLQNNNIKEGAQAFAESLRINSHLTALKLGDNQIGFDGTRAIAEALHVNRGLKCLNIISRATAVQGLVGALRVNTTLTSLTTGWIEDRDAVTLLEALRVNSTLTRINLGSSYRGDVIMGLRHGYGEVCPHYGPYREYKGDWKDDRMHGNGIIVYMNCNKFVGKFDRGLMSEGTFKFGCSDKDYLAEFSKWKSNDLFSSPCWAVLRDPDDGSVYREGWFRDGKFDIAI